MEKCMKIIDSKTIPTRSTSNHASNLLQLEKGDLLCAWFAGSMEGASDISIYLSRFSLDTGAWSPAEKMSADDSRSEQNPALFRMPSGELWLLYTAQIKTDQGTSLVRRRRSTDGGHTWTKSEDLFTEAGTFIRHPPVINGAGSIILPVFQTSIKNAFGDDSSLVKVSIDDGNTWSTTPVPNSGGCVHMNILENCSIAFFRSRRADYIYKSLSADDGLTWSEPEPTPLPNNNSSIQARLLKDGRIAIIYNENRASGRACETSIPPWIQDKKSFLEQCRITEKSAVWGVPRNPLVISSSEDSGRTWVKELVVESDPALRSEHDENGSFTGDYSYPSIIETDDGNVHLSYTYLREGIKHVIISF